jgi:DNA replication protein DnaC
MKKKSMCKEICSICKEEGEYEGSGYSISEQFTTRETICSLECHKKDREIKEQERYEKELVGIPIKYRKIDCDKELMEKNFSQNLFITGKSGVGKTVLAAGIAKECIKKRRLFKWLSYSAFIMELQSLYKSDNESPFERAEEVANFDGVLFIDDLGANKPTEWVRQITYYIINEREQRMLPIVITSNFSLEEIAEQIDTRISSRIIGMCKTIKLSGKDRRLDDNNKRWQVGEHKFFTNRSGYRKP